MQRCVVDADATADHVADDDYEEEEEEKITKFHMMIMIDLLAVQRQPKQILSLAHLPAGQRH